MSVARRWTPLAAAVVLAGLWVLLALRTPTTTYHLAPLLVSAAAPVSAGWLSDQAPDRRRAIGLTLGGLGIAAATAAGLAWGGKLAGPDLLGGDRAGLESGLMAVLGSAPGWWLAARRPASVKR